MLRSLVGSEMCIRDRDKEQQNWPGYPPHFHPSMMNWRMQMPPGYEPPQGAPQGSAPGGVGFPYPHFPYYMPPFGMPPNMQPGQVNKEKSEEGDKMDKQEGDKTNLKPFREDTDTIKRKAAAQAKLQQLEQKMKLKTKKPDDLAVEDLDKEPSSLSSHCLLYTSPSPRDS